MNNDDLEIEIYADSDISSEIQPLANKPIGTTYYTYTYGGTSYKMKNYTVAYRNLSTGMIEKTGIDVLNQAQAWLDFTVSALGAVSKKVTAFGIFSSAYDLFKAYRGEVVTGSSQDRIYTNLIYDRLMKETYVADIYNYYNLDCVSYKVWLNRHDSYQYYGSTGQSCSGNHTLNEEHFSENFQNPNPVAIQFPEGSHYIDGFQYTTVFNTIVRLMGT